MTPVTTAQYKMNLFFGWSFDSNRDRTITANVDINYGLYLAKPNKLGNKIILGPGKWTWFYWLIHLIWGCSGIWGKSNSSAFASQSGVQDDLNESNVALSWPLSNTLYLFWIPVFDLAIQHLPLTFQGIFNRDFAKLKRANWFFQKACNAHPSFWGLL